MEFVPAAGKGEQGFYREQQEEEEEEEEEEDEQDLDLQIFTSSSKGMLQSATIPPSASPSSSNYYNSNKSRHLSSINVGRWGNSPQIHEQMRRSEHYFSFDGGARGGDQLDHGGGDRARGFAIEREHMFDKVVTPSDVGKLNRLVIPKQHAEKYFPLDSSNNEKGLLLNFEDRNGKSWRFRYSYWNSSQSYVMTKGWSRFVKDKKLDAGDIVSFHRGLGEFGKDRFYIDWRRRPDPPLHDPSSAAAHHFSFHHHHRSSVPWSPLLFRGPPAGTTTTVGYPRDHVYLSHPHKQWMSTANYHHPYRNHSGYGYGHGSVVGVRGSGSNYGYGNVRNTNQIRRDGEEDEAMVLESVPVVQGAKVTGKKLRLFGVNMECPSGSELDDCDVLESATRPHANLVSHSPQLSSSSHPHLQLRLYNGTPLHLQPNNNDNKGKACSNSIS